LHALNTALTFPLVLDVHRLPSIIKVSLPQVYGGCTYANCRNGARPRFEYLPADRLPPLWLMHAATPSDSGKVHTPVRERWKAGDESILSGMRNLAALADTARCAAA
jgi:glucuronokinase